MREHFGPGWRMYYVQRGAALIVMKPPAGVCLEALIVMLGGGGKSTQQADIRKAIDLAHGLEDL